MTEAMAEPQDDTANFGAVPIEMTVAVGKAMVPIKDLLALERGTVIKMNRRLEDPVDLFVSGRLIAQGILELVDHDGDPQLGVRITEVVGFAGGAGETR